MINFAIDAIMVFLNFLNFFSFFFEFTIMRREGTERNENFYFISFTSFSNPFSPEMLQYWYFFYILNFLAIFLKFCIRRWVGTKRNENFYLYLSHPFPTYFGLK